MEKEGLTNEKLRKKFKSQFDLVGYAIRLADNMIMTGRGPRVRTETQNPAMQVLAEIAADKDQFDVILEKAPRQDEERNTHQEEAAFSGKGSDRKKTRRNLAD